MTALLTAVGILYLVGTAYKNGRQEGNQGGWSAAWRQAREKYWRHRRGK